MPFFQTLRLSAFAILILFTAPFLLIRSATAEVNTYGPFEYDSDVQGVLLLNGEITDGLVYNFRKALREHDITIIFLSSPGGNVYEALELSAVIADRQLSTVIPPNSDCASACSFLFVAGAKRQAYGRLGVHQFSSNGRIDGSVAETVSQTITGDIIDFLKEYDIPLIFMVRMLETPSHSMYWFPDTELQREKIETEDDFNQELARFKGVPTLPANIVKTTAPTNLPTTAPDNGRAASILPSFDCAKAGTPTEFSICGNAILAEMDTLMAKRYRALRNQMQKTDANLLKAEQRQWINWRDSCGADVSCLEQAYMTRMFELGL